MLLGPTLYYYHTYDDKNGKKQSEENTIEYVDHQSSIAKAF
jgi:hypothetical protein